MKLRGTLLDLKLDMLEGIFADDGWLVVLDIWDEAVVTCDKPSGRIQSMGSSS